MALSLSDQLTNVEAAIARAENAQEYMVGGRRTRYADLKALYARRDQLQARIDRESSGGIFSVVAVDRPR